MNRKGGDKVTKISRTVRREISSLARLKTVHRSARGL